MARPGFDPFSRFGPPSRGGQPSRCAWGVPLAVLAAILAVSACRSREGERCVCAEDCREGLLCVVASGRVLGDGECSPSVGEGSTPGVCLPEDEAADDDGGDGQVEPFMDLGSKLDFEPGPPPDLDTETAGTTEATGPGTTTEATGTTDGTGSSGTTGTTDGTGSSGTTDASGSGTGTTDASSTAGSGSSGTTGAT